MPTHPRLTPAQLDVLARLTAAGWDLYGHGESHEPLLRRDGRHLSVCLDRSGAVRCLVSGGRVVALTEVAS